MTYRIPLRVRVHVRGCRYDFFDKIMRVLRISNHYQNSKNFSLLKARESSAKIVQKYLLKPRFFPTSRKIGLIRFFSVTIYTKLDELTLVF